ncbi:recombinase family protein [Pyxidicoccus parkwayensis]|uniref:Recombinase family protein n=1 Tax=Pyxidicoccus parkwayensis TaxID=2813578 RepID=A0ABX7P8B8_9BACT|nr:recombinase family protein [Pyxidicoccus parkwaysis]QSQ26624.1 recombinase family protein [Pyxidicoccus parkwaysis]QSQ26696.1 recombinase family protein [Pyxidicoccus parkwaysis]
MSDKLQATHLQRRAVVYLRQSTLKQVLEHHESTTRQYALKQRAQELGWPAGRIDVIDEDLGQSGAGSAWRSGFQRLAEEVAHGRVGLILALEVSRLARSSADWQRLLELCALADVLIADEQAIYTPRDYNDRLLLGLKGTMSEAEQYWMRLRLQGGKLSKARRGELFLAPPVGYQWNEATHRLCLDPDEQVQRAVRLVFERFRLEGSGYAVVRYFARHGLKLPTHQLRGRQVHWSLPRYDSVLDMLHNPLYAGAYVYGRKEVRMALVEGQVKQRHTTVLPLPSWKVCLFNHHPAYLSWEEFMTNQKKLESNRTHHLPHQHGAAREGAALLQGLVLCGKCGHSMGVRYRGATHSPYYECSNAPGSMGGKRLCWLVAARGVDEAVARLFLEAVQPPEVELGLAVAHEVERQAEQLHQQWKLRMERTRYEAQLAERRYKAVDPDNRVVARTLEHEWNDKLRELEELESQYQQERRRQKLELSEQDRARILTLSKSLPRVWSAPSTTNAERKNLLRILVQKVALSPIEVPSRQIRVQVVWVTGAVTDFTLPRRQGFQTRSNPAEAVELILQLFQQKSDAQIAAELNQRGLRSGANLPWNTKTVHRVLNVRGLHRAMPAPQCVPAPARRADGLYSVHGVAERFGVSEAIVRYWMARGWLEPTEGGGRGHVCWFKLDRQALRRLNAGRARSSSSSSNPMQHEVHYA